MGYRINKQDTCWTQRKGLEGPFRYPNGRVLYYDPKAGEYWDPTTDWYVPSSEVADLQNSILRAIKG